MVQFLRINLIINRYGQTSAGKTFTMEGPDYEDKEKRGIIPRMVDTLFDYISNSDPNIEFIVQVSMLEIYNEKIRDLIDPTRMNLKVHESREKGVYVGNASEYYVSSSDEILHLLKVGWTNRSVGETNMNKFSSRSHSIFVITIGQRNLETLSRKRGRLYLVDLAGSEKVLKTGAEGLRLDEAKNINKSLFTLGSVINALTDGKSTHIPYRDSQLTRILQEALGGNSKTALILNCSPAKYNIEETESTLRFGTRAKQIKNKAVINAEKSPAELKMELEKAKKENEELKEKISKLSGGKFEFNDNHTKSEYEELKQKYEEALDELEDIQIQLEDEQSERIRYEKISKDFRSKFVELTNEIQNINEQYLETAEAAQHAEELLIENKHLRTHNKGLRKILKELSLEYPSESKLNIGSDYDDSESDEYYSSSEESVNIPIQSNSPVIELTNDNKDEEKPTIKDTEDIELKINTNLNENKSDSNIQPKLETLGSRNEADTNLSTQVKDKIKLLDYKKRISDLEEEINTLNEGINIYQSDNDKLKNDYDILNKKYNDSSKELSNVKESYEKLKEQLNNLGKNIHSEEETEDAIERISQLTDLCKAQETVIMQLQDDIQKARSEKNEILSEYSELKLQVLNNEKQKIDNDSDTIIQQYNQITTDFKVLQEKNNITNDRLKTVQEKVKQLEDRNKVLSNLLNQSVNDENDLKKSEAEYTEAYLALMNDVVLREQQIQLLNDNLHNRCDRVIQLEVQLDACKEQIKTFDQAYMAQGNKKDLKDQIRKLEIKLKEKDQQIQKLNMTLHVNEKKIMTLNEQLNNFDLRRESRTSSISYQFPGGISTIRGGSVINNTNSSNKSNVVPIRGGIRSVFNFN